jgi:hypothetical protein
MKKPVIVISIMLNGKESDYDNNKGNYEFNPILNGNKRNSPKDEDNRPKVKDCAP